MKQLLAHSTEHYHKYKVTIIKWYTYSNTQSFNNNNPPPPPPKNTTKQTTIIQASLVLCLQYTISTAQYAQRDK